MVLERMIYAYRYSKVAKAGKAEELDAGVKGLVVSPQEGWNALVYVSPFISMISLLSLTEIRWFP